MTAPIDRRAARVLLLDAQDRLLLFLGRDPANAARGQWWFTPGGGLDPLRAGNMDALIGRFEWKRAAWNQRRWYDRRG